MTLNYRRETVLERIGVFRECERTPTKALIEARGVEGALQVINGTIGRLESLLEIQCNFKEHRNPCYRAAFHQEIDLALAAEQFLANSLTRIASKRGAH